MSRCSLADMLLVVNHGADTYTLLSEMSESPCATPASISSGLDTVAVVDGAEVGSATHTDIAKDRLA